MHVDIKRLGNIPDGCGWRTVGRTTGNQNPQATTDQRKSCNPVIGYSYIHSAVDDHSRLACSEVLADERQHTAIGFWQRAQTFPRPTLPPRGAGGEAGPQSPSHRSPGRQGRRRGLVPARGRVRHS